MSWEESEPEFAGPISTGDREYWNRFFNGVLVGLLVLVVLMVVGFFLPMFTGHSGKPGPLPGFVSMMEINKALILFSDEYGSFPNDKTGALLAEKYPNIAGLKSPMTSNDYFKQMVVAGYLDEDVIVDLSKLERGVVYVVWQEKVPTESAAPLLVSPMVDGQMLFDWKYAKKHTKRSAMIARADGSVTTRRMLEDGQVYYGQNPKVGFFESYGIPWWEEQEWKLAWPR